MLLKFREFHQMRALYRLILWRLCRKDRGRFFIYLSSSVCVINTKQDCEKILHNFNPIKSRKLSKIVSYLIVDKHRRVFSKESRFWIRADKRWIFVWKRPGPVGPIKHCFTEAHRNYPWCDGVSECCTTIARC